MILTILLLLAAFTGYAFYHGGLRNIARERKYKSGTGWCVWRWTDVDSEYILRLHVFKTPWCAVCLHWFNKPDAEPWLHDHPVSFLSLILRGSYAELRASGDGDIGHKVHRWFNFVHARRTDRHRIIFCRKNTLTLCLMGPKTREWGFHMPEGWVGWKDYYARLKDGEDMRACRGGCTLAEWEALGGKPEPLLPALNRELTAHFTEARTLQAVGAPVGTPVDEDTRPVDGGVAVSREQFYKTFEMDFGDEDPTEPRR